jgi:hypothetical protein
MFASGESSHRKPVKSRGGKLPSLSMRIVTLALVLTLLIPSAWAQVPTVNPAEIETGIVDFFCGTQKAGTLKVKYDGEVRLGGGPFESAPGSGYWSILGQMRILATATTLAPGSPLAWMQAIVGNYTAGAVFSDPLGNALASPWPDTPPGGYLVTDIFGQPIAPPGNQQVFDNEPWYGNNTVGQLQLFDQPANGRPNGGALNFNFESWLVCFTGKAGDIYNVIPLMGFTWGYTFDANDTRGNNNGITGDILNEYNGSTAFNGFLDGTAFMPSDEFKTGYAKYFQINYLENNDLNCAQCPEPEFYLFVLIACIGLLLHRRRMQRIQRSCVVLAMPS